MVVPLKYAFLVQRLIESSDGILKFGTIKKGAIRMNKVNPLLNLEEPTILQILFKSLVEVIQTIPPKAANSASSKFITYLVLDTTNQQQQKIIIANGGNNGHNFEHKIEQQIKRAILFQEWFKDPLLRILEAAGAINTQQIEYTPIAVKRSTGLPPKRKLSNELNNIGKDIADLTLTLQNGEPVYLSLKNINGSTFSNTGIKDSFEFNSWGNIYPKDSALDGIFQTFGVDKFKVACGCSAYQNQIYYPKESDTTPNIHYSNALSYIRSGFGFGYWYVREKGLEDYQVINLTTLEKLSQHVVNIQVQQVQYPYYHSIKDKSKQCSVDLFINTHRNKPDKIRIEIRNPKGGIIPIELKMLKK